MFQNHYGWIETYKENPFWREFLKFQNHYGWIETKDAEEAQSKMVKFQNHYGWIETHRECGLPRTGAGFKTTTVGLRLESQYSPTICIPVSKPLRLD